MPGAPFWSWSWWSWWSWSLVRLCVPTVSTPLPASKLNWCDNKVFHASNVVEKSPRGNCIVNAKVYKNLIASPQRGQS